MKTLGIFMSLLLLLAACGGKPQPSQLPDDSIFHLSSTWKNQNGTSMKLKDLQGKTLVVVMIYTSCKSACPILVSKMKLIESKISRKDIEQVNLVLVTIDPTNDVPEKLKEFAQKRGMKGPQWTFLTSNEDDTQEFANLLAMKYKKIDPIDFSHSNIITVFNPYGEMVSQEEGLEINVDRVVSDVKKTVKTFN
jgi:protein SCO1/2